MAGTLRVERERAIVLEQRQNLRERERVVERLVTCRERTKTVTECLKKF